MHFTLTKEGMYRSSRWTISRIKHTATRASTVTKSVAMLCIRAAGHRTAAPAGRLLRFLRLAVPPVCTFAAILAAGWVVTGGAGWLWLAVLASAGCCWNAALKGLWLHYPSGSASATVKKV